LATSTITAITAIATVTTITATADFSIASGVSGAQSSA
jgi:hypothetical protein